MKTVTILGSCRIHEPLAHLASAGMIRINNIGKSGYIHSLGEAIQFVSCLQGKQILEPATRVFTMPGCLKDIDAGVSSRHADTDIFIVEVSSIKEFILDSQYIQMNMLQKMLRAHGSEAYFFVLCKLMNANKGSLIKIPRLHKRMDAITRTVLMGLSGVALTFDLIVRHLKALRTIVRKPLLLITHINVPGKEGDAIVTLHNRLDGITMLRNAGQQLGIPVVEPGDLVAKWGVDKAMEYDSTNHYQKSFEPQLAHWFYRKFIRYM